MGLLGTYVVYRVGKASGKRAEERRRRAQDEKSIKDLMNPDCSNYSSFCMNFGSCDGMECTYE